MKLNSADLLNNSLIYGDNDDEKRGSCPWCGRDLIVADENEDGSYTCHCGYTFTEEGPLTSPDEKKKNA